MAQTDTRKLDNHQPFPTVRLPLVDGTALTLPDDVRGKWCVFQVYRGHW
jgi:hypothetical protein